jgi:hypothetical protein
VKTDGPFIDFPILRVEVTVAAAIQMPDGTMLGHNMVDATLAFGWRTGPTPAGASDARIGEALSRGMSPVLAIVQTALTFNDWVPLGQVDEPMVGRSKPTGGMARMSPVRVHVSFPDEGAAVHD